MHIESLAIIVDDYDAAIDFFVEGLGFDLVEASPSLTNDGRAKRWVIVRPPGALTLGRNVAEAAPTFRPGVVGWRCSPNRAHALPRGKLCG